MWKKKDRRDSETQVEHKRLTPIDIQQAVFRRALFRGYREEEVDDFLDRVTEEIALLLEEQRRLRDQAAGLTGPPIREGEGASSGVSPFLRTERTFLRELAQIIQNHAEAVREMAEASRRAPAAPEVPPPPPVEAPAAEEPPPTVLPEAEEEVELEPEPEVEQEVEPEVEPEAEPAETGVFGEEQPSETEAPVGQAGGRERSLKELFWGED